MRFLWTLALGLFLLLGAHAQTTERALGRPTTSGMLALEINQTVIGSVRSFSGGLPYGEIAQQRLGPDQLVTKFINGVKYEPLTIQIGMGTASSPAFLEILNSWQKKVFSGAIIQANIDNKVMKRLEFQDAIITEITLPPLNAASRDMFILTVTLQPEITRNIRGDGKSLVLDSRKEKLVTVNNFRVQMEGLDLSRVTRIGALGMRQKAMVSPGRLRNDIITGGNAEYSDLIFTMSEAHADSLEKLFDSTVIQNQRRETDGKLEILGADLKTVMLTISLRNLGIWRLGPLATPEAGRETPPTTEARFYLEGMFVEKGT
jgi:hypothetical protein